MWKDDSFLIKRESWQAVRNEFCTYLWLNLRILLGWWPEYIGFEFNTFLVGITIHDNVRVSTYAIFLVFYYIFRAIGSSFAIATKIRVGGA